MTDIPEVDTVVLLEVAEAAAVDAVVEPEEAMTDDCVALDETEVEVTMGEGEEVAATAVAATIVLEDGVEVAALVEATAEEVEATEKVADATVILEAAATDDDAVTEAEVDAATTALALPDPPQVATASPGAVKVVGSNPLYTLGM